MDQINNTNKPRPIGKKKTARSVANDLAMPFLSYFSGAYKRGYDWSAAVDQNIDKAVNASLKSLQFGKTVEDADEIDYQIVAYFLSTIVYGKRGRGAANVWKESRLRLLDEEFQKLKRKNPEKNDLSNFKELAKTGKFFDQKKRTKAPSGAALQRQWQMAQKGKLI